MNSASLLHVLDQHKQEVVDLDAFINVCLTSFERIPQAVKHLNWIKEHWIDSKLTDIEVNSEEILAQINHVSKVESHIFELKRREFSLLFEVGVVRACSILDNSVDRMLEIALKEVIEHADNSTISKLEIRIVEFMTLSEEEKPGYLVARLKEKVAVPLKADIGRFEALLATVGLSGTVHDVIRRNLLEMYTVRNVIVHKAGLVDRRAIQTCPWLRWPVGHQLDVSYADFSLYLAACIGYGCILVDRVRAVNDQPLSGYKVLAEIVDICEQLNLTRGSSPKGFSLWNIFTRQSTCQPKE